MAWQLQKQHSYTLNARAVMLAFQTTQGHGPKVQLILEATGGVGELQFLVCVKWVPLSVVSQRNVSGGCVRVGA